MNHDSFVCEIRCPVHGFIGLTSLERLIIDQPAFQRLRRIKQLAWTDYVYPGASHSRFEHSLGVMHIAGKLFESVVSSSSPILRDVFGYTEGGLARDWQIVRLAGLMHDIGHAPFSHATEHLLPMKRAENLSLFPGQEPVEQYEHEDYSVAIIESLFSDLIEQHSANRRNNKITAQEVTALIAKRAPGGTSLFWKDIISGQLDADRMDYLLRDSLHAGVSYGHFDINRIVSSVCAIRRPSEETDEPKIAIMRGGAYAAEALIVARYWMHKQVYFHKTRLACNYHLEEAVRNILKNGDDAAGTIYYPRPDTIEQLSEFLKWDDYRVMGMLATGHGGEHGTRLMTRNHYRLVCELQESDATVADLAASVAQNEEVIQSLGDLVKHVTSPKTLWYKAKGNDLILVDDDTHAQVGYFSQYSSLMRSINFGSLRFVYADKPDAEQARDQYRDFLKSAATKPSFATKTEAEQSITQPGRSFLRVAEASSPPDTAVEPKESLSPAHAQLNLVSVAQPKAAQSENTISRGAQNAS